MDDFVLLDTSCHGPIAAGSSLSLLPCNLLNFGVLAITSAGLFLPADLIGVTAMGLPFAASSSSLPSRSTFDSTLALVFGLPLDSIVALVFGLPSG